MNADGSNINLAIPAAEWAVKGGHHPNWCPDGKHVMMNLKYDGENMRLVQALYDGTNYCLMHDNIVGSGHPSLHPDKKTIITDTYLFEDVSYGDGTVPIRYINLKKGESKNIIRIRTKPDYNTSNNELQVDPHPAWDSSYRYIIFNACPDGKRKVFIADMKEVMNL
jgi:Tol biopolymer transport system component